MARPAHTPLAYFRKSKQDCAALLRTGDGVNNSIELMTQLSQYLIELILNYQPKQKGQASKR